MAYLYKHTGLQTNFNVNMTALVPSQNTEVGTPQRLSLKEILRYFLEFRFDEGTTAVAIEVTAETLDRTGVEMEALTAASIGLLTIYDMCKAVDRAMRIEQIRLLEKSGGKSGHFRAE